MVKQNIQEKIKKLKGKKEKIDKEINSLKNQFNEPTDYEWIILDKDFEVTKEVLYKEKTFNEIMQLKKPNEELLTLKQIAIILENPELTKELKMDAEYSTNDDFFFKQPCKTNQTNGYVARFYSDSYGSDFDLNEDADRSYRALGVRFVRKKAKKMR